MAVSWAISNYNFGPQGGSVTVQLSAGAGEAWQLIWATDFLSVYISPRSGVGPAAVTFTTDPATQTSPKYLTVTAAVSETNYDQIHLSQDASPHTSVTPTSQSLSSDAQSYQISISSNEPWTLTNAPSWVSLSAPSGMGSATLTITVTANTGPARSAAIDINGASHTVNQAAALVETLSPPNKSLTAAAQSFTVDIVRGAGWTAASSAPWLTVSPASGSGSAAITVSAAVNTGAAARSGQVSVGAQTCQVYQAAPPVDGGPWTGGGSAGGTMLLLGPDPELIAPEPSRPPVERPSEAGFESLIRYFQGSGSGQWPPGLSAGLADAEFPRMFARSSRRTYAFGCVPGLTEWEVEFVGEFEERGAVRTGVSNYPETISGEFYTPTTGGVSAPHNVLEPHVSCKFRSVATSPPDTTQSGTAQTPPDPPAVPPFIWSSIGSPRYNYPSGWVLVRRDIVAEIAGVVYDFEDEYVFYNISAPA